MLATVIAGGLYQVVIYQQRVHQQERATVARHDALRLASFVLASDLMEANGREGDLVALAPDTLVIRSPVGFAIVCVVDSANDVLGLFDVSGRVSASSGDSLLVYHPSGWLVRAVAELNPAGAPLSCPYGSGPLLELSLRAGSTIAGVPVGAPVRAFRRYTYHLERSGTSWLLARTAGSTTDILAGPFSGDGSGLVFAFFDSTGAPTTDPTQVARVDLALVAESRGRVSRRDTLTSTVRPRNQ